MAELQVKSMPGAYQPILGRTMPAPEEGMWIPPIRNRESYNAMTENGFVATNNDPLSTFSIDVDTASYSNIRRFINQGDLPPVGAVRIEEMVNYFHYSYPEPAGKHPFSVTGEVGPCPWKEGHKLVRIGIKAKNIAKKNLPPSNLVFLVDVSGSMAAANKLPLLKKAMKMLVRQLDKDDRVSMVVYAGMDSVVLTPTTGSEQKKIMAAIDALGAGGSTHASSGIITAYKLAQQVYMPRGNNRIILASDGDFNVGITSRGELQRLIEEKRKSGIYLTVLGFGMGNYHDDTMEILADKGNGNYAYIDNLLEAKKVMVKEMSGTMFTLARDVKLQIEFNPVKVAAYRLIGYENRALADEDFNNDSKDAGEIGVGHTVTALYELIPAGSNEVPSVDPLKYQKISKTAQTKYQDEIMTIKLRYKPLNSNKSVLLSKSVEDRETSLARTSDDFRFAAAVAALGMILEHSPFSGDFDFEQVLTLAKKARGADDEGYRAEFIRLVETGDLLNKSTKPPQAGNTMHGLRR
ncbi:MAG TPA: VWA domain-containing protein [Desulfobulbaceae bacterium]|nr:VWA domain-containing protein [Desulfobulbaceae bacterium]